MLGNYMICHPNWITLKKERRHTVHHCPPLPGDNKCRWDWQGEPAHMSPKVARWSQAPAKLMQPQLSRVLYKCGLLHRTHCPLWLMIAGVICIIMVAILTIIAASVDWYSSYCTKPLKTSSHFIFTVMRSEHYQTHFTDGKTGDRVKWHAQRPQKWVFKPRTEFKGPHLNCKLLVLSLFIFTCIPCQGGQKIQHTPPPFTIHSSPPAIAGSFSP